MSSVSSVPASSDSKPPGATEWGAYMLKLYASRSTPFPLGTVVYEEIEEKARQTLKDHIGAFLYTFGSAGTNKTYAANLKIFEQYRLIPRMLVDATTRTLETTIFGVKHTSPLFIAPIGVQGIVHPDGEVATARAAKNLGVPFIMSTASSRSIEQVAEANGDGHRWYQLYWPRTNDVALSILNRAKASGFKALVITLDTMSLGWRPHDLEAAYLPFWHGYGIGVGRSDPVFMARYNVPPSHEPSPFPYEPDKLTQRLAAGDEKVKQDTHLGIEWLKECNSGQYRAWEDLEFIRQNWDGPLILKGIQHVEDAERALEHGVNGIIVSNHGGRQVDGAIPSLYALTEIMKSPKIQAAQREGKLTIIFDSGIRTGSDILKALALGAQAVLLGRPFVYGLAVGGQAGVEQIIQQTLADLHVTLGLVGARSLAEIQGKGAERVTRLDL